MVGTRIVSSTSNVRASTICMNEVCYKKKVVTLIKDIRKLKLKTDLCESHNLLAQSCPVSSVKFNVPYTPSRRLVASSPFPRIIRQPRQPSCRPTISYKLICTPSWNPRLVCLKNFDRLRHAPDIPHSYQPFLRSYSKF